MRSKQDQPNNENEKSKTQATHTEKFIRQIGPRLEIGKYDYNNANIIHSIECGDQGKARQLALELSGTKFNLSCEKKSSYTKLQSHPWYGLVLLEELFEDDKNIIALFIDDNSIDSDQDFKIQAHRLFIDDSKRPIDHALIHEMLMVIATSRGNHD